MPWEPEHREKAQNRLDQRKDLPHTTDLLDCEWDAIKCYIPPHKIVAVNRVLLDLRSVLNAIIYIDVTGAQWAHLPKTFPKYKSVHKYFMLWTRLGVFDKINISVIFEERKREGKDNIAPTVVLIDTQSRKSGSNRGGAGLDESGYDGAKKVLGHKRAIVTDSDGRLLEAEVASGDTGERVLGVRTVEQVKSDFPSVIKALGDSGYRGQPMVDALAEIGVEFEVVTSGQKNGVFVPNCRWPVERAYALLCQCRRLCNNNERFNITHRAMIMLSSIRIHLRRMADCFAV